MAKTLFVGTKEGVVKVSVQNGSSTVEEHSLRDWEVPEVLPSPGNPQRVFAATRGDGVWRSDDGGRSWNKPSYGRPAPGKVRCLAFDPTNSDVVYAGGEPISLWKSEDAGQTWREIESLRNFPFIPSITYPVPVVEPHVRDITIDPGDPRIMLVALQVGYMLKTTDGGQTWKLLDKGLDADVHTIVMDPRDAKRVFIATGGHDARSEKAPGRALYRSADGGATWSPMAMDFEQEYSVPLVIDPSEPSVLYSAVASGNPGSWRKREAGADARFIRSTDAGESWEALPTVSELSRGFAEAIVVDEDAARHVFAATRPGALLESSDGGESWRTLPVTVPETSDMKIAYL